MNQDKEDRSLWAVLEVPPGGWLKTVFLHAETKDGEKTLTRTLDRLFKPSAFSWVRRIFRGGRGKE